MTNIVYFNANAFRVQFPAFESPVTYSDATLNMYFGTANAYVQNNGGWTPFSCQQLTQAMNLFTAHLAFLGNAIANGNAPTIVSASSIDKISVTLEPPPAKNQFQWWLNTSPYGAQLLALLEIVAVGGAYVSTGIPGRAGFRFGGNGF